VIVGAPILILYAQGYRLADIGDAFTFRETGGVYVAAGLSGVSVSVDDEARDQTSFLSHGVLIQNLTEGEYLISTTRPGYFNLGKALPVYPSIVTEWRPLLLPDPVPLREIPEFVATAATSSSVKVIPFVKNPERTSVLALFAPATSTPKAGATSTLVAANPNLVELLVEADLPSLVSEPTLRRSNDLIVWIDNLGAVRLVWLGSIDSTPQYLCSPTGCKEGDMIRLPLGVNWLDFLPGRTDALIAITPTGAYAVEIDGRGGRAILPILEQPGVEARVFGGSLYLKLGQKVWEVEI